jgi:diguanylate cyclase (GGDEF)-like protein
MPQGRDIRAADRRAANRDSALPADLGHRLADVVQRRGDLVIGDLHEPLRALDAASARAECIIGLGRLTALLLASTIRHGRADAPGGMFDEWCRAAAEGRVQPRQVFDVVSLVERGLLDDLAAGETLGAATDEWPGVVQLVRRASYDVLAAYAERLDSEPTRASIVDRATTLYARPVFDAVLQHAVARAARTGERLVVLLFDVDNFGRLNAEHGTAIADRILERLGVLVRGSFRQEDWVARHGGDSVAVLLASPDPAHGATLADLARSAVAERLTSVDHRTGGTVHVTVSAAVVEVEGKIGRAVDPLRIIAEGEAALQRALRQGGNRVEATSVAAAQ